MHRDFIEFIDTLNEYKADFVIIGGVALAHFGFPGYTGDLDIWIRPGLQNIGRVFSAIEDFFSIRLSITPDEFIMGHNMITMGEEPVQIQLRQKLDGVSDMEIWENRTQGKFGQCGVYYIGEETFIKNKQATGRPQDLVDITRITGK